jgi:hypothetical protein
MNISEARQEAAIIVKLIVSGNADAYDGAMTIWKEVLDKLDGPIPDDLWPFKSNASAIEDILWNEQDCGSRNDASVARCKSDILQAAKLLLAPSLPDHSREVVP